MQVQLSISPKFAKQVTLVLSFIAVGLAVLSLASEALMNSSIFSSLLQQGGSEDGQIMLFALDAEQTIPTWYSSSTLLICAGLLAIISMVTRRGIRKLHWAGLSLAFLYLSVDETVSIHEKASSAIGVLLPFGSFSNFAWTIVYAPFVFVFGLVYLNFARALPVETKHLFIVAGVLYVGGALGMEAIGGLYAILYGELNVVYYLLTQLEEVFEMFGVVIFLYALLLYISSYVREINIGSKGRL